MSAEELRDFLQDQGEDASLRQARAIIRTYELNEKGRAEDSQLGWRWDVGMGAAGAKGWHGMGLCLVMLPPQAGMGSSNAWLSVPVSLPQGGTGCQQSNTWSCWSLVVDVALWGQGT